MSLRHITVSVVIGILFILVTAEAVRAQSTGNRLAFGYQETELTQLELKSEKTALHRSLWHTLAPVVSGYLLVGIVGEDTAIPATSLLVYGLMIGPSTGNIYAHDWKRGFNGFLFRGLGIGTMILSEAYSGELLDGGPSPGFYGSGSSFQATDVVLAAGIVIFAGGIVYNFVTADQSVREYNERVRQGIGVRMAPSLDMKTGTPLLIARITF